MVSHSIYIRLILFSEKLLYKVPCRQAYACKVSWADWQCQSDCATICLIWRRPIIHMKSSSFFIAWIRKADSWSPCYLFSTETSSAMTYGYLTYGTYGNDLTPHTYLANNSQTASWASMRWYASATNPKNVFQLQDLFPDVCYIYIHSRYKEDAYIYMCVCMCKVRHKTVLKYCIYYMTSIRCPVYIVSSVTTSLRRLSSTALWACKIQT